MTAKDYKELEDKIISLFKIGDKFQLNDVQYEISISGKAKPNKGRGEPKTDVFIRGISLDEEQIIDLKISVKMEMDNVFVENKITPERFKSIFSKETQKLISNKLYNETIPNMEFKDIFKAGRFPLGWKAEIAINDNRKKRIRVTVTREEAEEIYAGKKALEKFKNAMVNKKIIMYSGIAEYILVTDITKVNSKEEVLSQLVPIVEYVNKDENRVFDFILTGFHLYPREDKANFLHCDGDRPVLIGVLWQYGKNGLLGKIDINNLFEYSGNTLSDIAREAIIKAGANLTSKSAFWKSLQGKISRKQLIFEKLNEKIKLKKPLRNQKTIMDF